LRMYSHRIYGLDKRRLQLKLNGDVPGPSLLDQRQQLLAYAWQVCCPCYCLAGARKVAIKKCRGSVPTPPGSLDADYGNRASNACEERYRQKARLSSRLSVKPEPSSCQSRCRRHRVRCEARKAEEAPQRWPQGPRTIPKPILVGFGMVDGFGPPGKKGHLREIGAQGFPQSPNILQALSSGWVGRGKAEADDGRGCWPRAIRVR